MRVFARVTSLALLSLLLIACEPGEKQKPDAQTQAQTTRETSAQLTRSTDDDASAVAYYTSPSRRAMLQAALDGPGQELAHRLLTNKIPSTVRSWQEGSTATLDGYNEIRSISNDPYYDVTVKYDNGVPDLAKGIFALSVHKGGIMYTLVGGAVITTQGQAVANVQSSWCWWASLSGTNTGPFVSESSGRQAYHEPIDPAKEYYVTLFSGHATVPELRHADFAFIAELQKAIGS